MVKHVAAGTNGASQRRFASAGGSSAGGINSGATAAAVHASGASASMLGGSGSSLYRREVELGSGSSSISGAPGGPGSNNVRQPLFGGSGNSRSDHPSHSSAVGGAGGISAGPDAADELFASVGRSPTSKRNGRNPWD